MKTGVCLSGAGGAIGFLAGALEVVQKRYSIDKITGVSSGALVGAMVSVGRTDQLFDILYNLTDDQIAKKRMFKYARRTLSHLIGFRNPLMGVYDNSPLRSMLRNELLGQTFQIDFSCFAVNIRNGSLATWTFPKGTEVTLNNIEMIVDQILSSTAIPFAFSPVKIAGEYYVDGGIETHTPIQPTKDLLPDMDQIIIISTHSDTRDTVNNIKSDIDLMPSVLSDLIGKVSEIDFLHFKYRNELAMAGADGYKYYPGVAIQPRKKLAPTLRFHHKFTRVDMYHGRDMARNRLTFF